MAGTVVFIELVSGTYTTNTTKVIDGTSVTTSNGGSPAVNTDIFLTGTSSISEKVSGAAVTTYFTGTAPVGEPWDFSSGGTDSGNHIFAIINVGGTPDTLANGGMGIVVADDLATDSVGTWYVGPQAGSLAGWEYFVINPSADFNTVTAGTASWTTTGNPAQLTGVDGVGVRWSVTNTVMGASDNCFLQTVMIGVGYRMTGTSAVFSEFATYEQTNRFGALQVKSGVLLPMCKLRIGVESGAGNVTFTDSNFTVIWQGQTLSDGSTKATAAGFYSLSVVQGTGTTDVTLSNGTLAAASPETFDLLLAGVNSVNITNLNVDRARLVTLDAGVDWDQGQVTNSGQIDASGAIFTNVKVLTSTVVADDGAVLWNDSGDPDGNLDGGTYTKGAAAHHAIEFGTSAPNTMTLRSIAFGTDWNASNEQNDSTLLFPDKGVDTTWTVNLVGCTGTVSYKRVRGTDTVNLVNDPRTVKVKTVTTSGTAITSATVHLHATGGFPAGASVSITSSGTTATVSHTAHGLASSDKVEIFGANETPYNGVFTITVTGANSYTYTMSTTASSPATGTITSTYVFFHGTTDGSGEISLSKVIPASTTATGWARKATSAPYYKEGSITGAVSSTQDTTFTAVMVADE